MDMPVWWVAFEKLESFLAAGKLQKKKDYISHVLERNNLRVTINSNRTQLIHLVFQHEIQRLKPDLKLEGPSRNITIVDLRRNHSPRQVIAITRKKE